MQVQIKCSVIEMNRAGIKIASTVFMICQESSSLVPSRNCGPKCAALSKKSQSGPFEWFEFEPYVAFVMNHGSRCGVTVYAACCL